MKPNFVRFFACLFCMCFSFSSFGQSETLIFFKTTDWGTGYNGKVNVTPNYAITTTWTLSFTIPSGSNVSNAWVTGYATSYTVNASTVTITSVGAVNLPANNTIGIEFNLNNGTANIANIIFNNANKTTVTPPNPSAPVNCNAAFPWNTSWAYNAGDEVVSNNVKYVANWYTQNQSPETNNGPNLVWTKSGTCQLPITYTKINCDNVQDWKTQILYSENDEVLRNGFRYKARYVNSYNDPEAFNGPTKAWLRVGFCNTPVNYTAQNCIGIASWSISQNYSVNDQVFYNGKVYSATTNNNYQNPETTNAWKLIGSCAGSSNQAWIATADKNLYNNNEKSVFIGSAVRVSPGYLPVGKLEVNGDVYAKGRLRGRGLDVFVNPDPTATDAVAVGGSISIAADGTPSISFKPKQNGGPWHHIEALDDKKLHFSIGDYSNKIDYAVIGETGNFGIGVGTFAPQEKLHVQGNILTEGNLIFKASSGKGIVFEDGSKLISLTDITNTIAQDVWVQKDNKAYIAHTGKVLIGDPLDRAFPQDYAFAVNGKILAGEVLVRKYTNWQNLPDYVFEKNYHLLSLSDLEKYVQVNKHLPEIPSAKSLAKDGINVADMQVSLLKKVEELTLYIIEQNKRLDSQSAELNSLKQQLQLR